MAASQLGVYNKALRWLEERPLGSLTENREPRRLLDSEWSDAVLTVLYDAYWLHAIRNVKVDASANEVPQFGYKYAFPKPPDWTKTYLVADNEIFDPPLRRYDDLNNVWYSDISPIYVKYVSSDPDWGWNMSLWTPGFSEYLGIHLAWLLCPRVKQWSQKMEELEKRKEMIRRRAIAKDAMDLPPRSMPVGTWVQSRAPRGSILPYWPGDE